MQPPCAFLSGVRSRLSFLLFLALCLSGVCPQTLSAETALSPPVSILVFDTPSDGGESLTVVWPPAASDGPGVKYQILLGEGPVASDPGALKAVAEFPSNSHYVRDAKSAWWIKPGRKDDHLFVIKNGKGIGLKNGHPYVVMVAAVSETGRVMSEPAHASPEPNWLNLNQLNNLTLAFLFGAVVFYAINQAKRKDLFLRRIPGLDAVDEAIGRATELGKPVLYMTGAHDMSDPSTIAAAVILGRVAKRAASYETELLVPHREPITMAVCQEITKQAYLEAGKPDLFKEDANFFITSDQFSYTAAVDGIMLRRKPAANFFMGSYFAESLAAHGDRRQYGRHSNRRHRFRSSTPVFCDDLRLHLDRRRTVRGQRLSVERTDSDRYASRSGLGKGIHSRGNRSGNHTRDDRGGHGRRMAASGTRSL